MTRNRTLTAALLLLAPLAFLTAGAGYAQTPDGETPAEEEVCDPLAGAAFGLCNAYCEAMDCHLRNDGDPNTMPNASDKACDKVLDNFIKITGMIEMPCEAAEPPACPEFDPGCLNGVCVDVGGEPGCNGEGLVCENDICVEEGV